MRPNYTLPRLWLDQRYGLDLRAEQYYTINPTGTLRNAAFWVSRSPASIGSGTVAIEVWSASGVAGNYDRVTLIDSQPAGTFASIPAEPTASR